MAGRAKRPVLKSFCEKFYPLLQKNLPRPQVMWAQRRDRIFLTVQLDDRKPTVELTEESIHFKGKGGSNNTEHEFTIVFNGSVNPDSSKYTATGRSTVFVIMKKEDSHGFWPRLLKDKMKLHFLKTDFEKWKDEDDSDVDEPEDFNLEEMMQSMGGLSGGGAGGDMGEGEEDSDDEELPDLQN